MSENIKHGDRMVVAKRIAEFRKGAVRMSVEEFANLTGISVKRLMDVESGKGSLKLSELCALADTFGVSMDYFLGIHRFPHPVVRCKQEAEFWMRIEHMTEEELKRFLEETMKQWGKEYEEVETVCYGEKKKWDSREEAKDFFRKAMAGSEGSEHQRYERIFEKLCLGMKVCSDEVE